MSEPYTPPADVYRLAELLRVRLGYPIPLTEAVAIITALLDALTATGRHPQRTAHRGDVT